MVSIVLLKRIAAFLLDILFIKIIFYILVYYFEIGSVEIAVPVSEHFVLNMSVLTVIIFISYSSFFECEEVGHSPGKKIMGLTVINKDSTGISLFKSMFRTYFKVLGLVVFPLGLISLLFSKRLFHDLVLKTVVIEVR